MEKRPGLYENNTNNSRSVTKIILYKAGYVGGLETKVSIKSYDTSNGPDDQNEGPPIGQRCDNLKIKKNN